jgi:NAD+ synthase
MDRLKIDEKEVAAELELFLQTKLRQSVMRGYVLGLSGGIDSSLSAAIAARAVGAENVLGIMMPYALSSESSAEDAKKVAETFGFHTEKIEISPMIDAYYPDIKVVDKVRFGNKMARERMSILFDRAFENNYLVCGTSNRTEICLGYGTWYGDVACSVNPIGMLYKTQVRQMAKYYGLPETVINKAPSADLWPGQTDENELGLEYDKADKLLYMIIEQGITNSRELNEAGIENAFIDRALSLLNRFYFKRQLPEIADLRLKPIPVGIKIT